MKNNFEKIKKYFVNRFKSFDVGSYVVLVSMFIFVVIGLYFSIGMSVTISKGLTLFGDSSNASNLIEVNGPTSSDILVITFFWIITVLLLLTFIYFLFFKKVKNNEDEK